MKLIIFTLLVGAVYCIPVDNGVEGEPEVECGPTAITVNFNTRNPFEGHVYVKGLYDQKECRNDEGGRQVAGIELPFDSCNTARTRSLNPRGVFVSTTVVISFHPQFVTKVDRAYRIQCFYMESDKTVSTQIEVSDLTTAFQTQVVPMPICRYEILDGGPSGQPIQFATIGQQVYHKWTCDSETTDTFCAVVHTCTVDDGNGDTVQILNEDGCALDKFLLNNLEYPSDLMAGQEAHVYKYADRSQLFYQCQISISIKDPGSECPRPQCAEPTGFGAVKQGAPRTDVAAAGAAPGGGAAPAAGAAPATGAGGAAGGDAGAAGAVGAAGAARGAAAGTVAGAAQLRLLRKRQVNNEAILDVRAEISALEITDNESLPSSLRTLLPAALVSNDRYDSSVCLSPLSFAAFIGLGILLATALSTFVFYFARPHHKY